jgi:hypothetical protein
MIIYIDRPKRALPPNAQPQHVTSAAIVAADAPVRVTRTATSSPSPSLSNTYAPDPPRLPSLANCTSVAEDRCYVICVDSFIFIMHMCLEFEDI